MTIPGEFDRFAVAERDPNIGHSKAVRNRLIALILIPLVIALLLVAYSVSSRAKFAQVFGGTVTVQASVLSNVLKTTHGRRGTTYSRDITVNWEEGGQEHQGTYNTSQSSTLRRGDVIQINVIPGSDAFSAVSTTAAAWALGFAVLWLVVLLVVGWLLYRVHRMWRNLFRAVRFAPWVQGQIFQAPAKRRKKAPLMYAMVQPAPGAPSTEPGRAGLLVTKRKDGQVLMAGATVYIWPTGRALFTKRPVAPMLLQDANTGTFYVANGSFPKSMLAPAA